MQMEEFYSEREMVLQAFFFGENDRSGYVEVTQNLFHANDGRS